MLAFSVLEEALAVVVIVSLLSLAQEAKNTTATITAKDDTSILFIDFLINVAGPFAGAGS